MDFLMVLGASVVIYYLVMWLYRRRTIGEYSDRYVFITGCDTGFGHMLALRLDRMGFHVFAACLTETGEDRLRKNASDRLVTLSLDVTNEKSIKNAFEFVKSNLPLGKGTVEDLLALVVILGSPLSFCKIGLDKQYN